jgi:hypothetical protein
MFATPCAFHGEAIIFQDPAKTIEPKHTAMLPVSIPAGNFGGPVCPEMIVALSSFARRYNVVHRTFASIVVPLA